LRERTVKLERRAMGWRRSQAMVRLRTYRAWPGSLGLALAPLIPATLLDSCHNKSALP
jgi:hypothetical protein